MIYIYTVLDILKLLVTFIFSLFAYFFHSYFNLVTVKLWSDLENTQHLLKCLTLSKIFSSVFSNALNVTAFIFLQRKFANDLTCYLS